MKLTLACARVLELPKEPPEWVDLLPAGRVEARDGRTWEVEDAAAVAAESIRRAGATDLAIDYEHQSHTDTGEAPAAAWIKEIRVEDGMIRAPRRVDRERGGAAPRPASTATFRRRSCSTPRPGRSGS